MRAPLLPSSFLNSNATWSKSRHPDERHSDEVHAPDAHVAEGVASLKMILGEDLPDEQAKDLMR